MLVRLIMASTALFGSAALAASPPQRIVSLNKCTDQLLLALVERSRIASVSPRATDELSFMAEELKALPANSGRGESVLLTDADLVLAGPFESHTRQALLRRQGFDVLVIGLWRTLAEGRAQIRELSRRLGTEDRGEALIAEIDAALARSRDAAPAPRTVLVLQQRGYTPGDTGILDELIRHMGLVPYSERVGVAHGGLVSLERLVADPPDYLLMSNPDGVAVDEGSAFLRHPALAGAVPPDRRLHLPARLTICGGPATPVAIDTLAAEVRAKVR
jgi:iron complex transport system substrate-binding protein